MEPWFDTVGVFIIADIGIFLGLLTTRLKKHFWLLGYIFPLSLILMIDLPRHIYRLVFYQPFSWINAGRREYVILAFAIPMLFSIIIPRLPLLRQKIILTIFVTISSVVLFVIPFISPIFVRQELEEIVTVFSPFGICLQSTDYTCGPAAAVTALCQLGIKASEGELAIHAYTTPETGTQDDLLVKAIEEEYSSQGITCTYRCFNSISELRGNCPAIVVTKYSFLIDHYVTVLKVTKDKVIFGDPSSGREMLSYEEFNKKWRSVGIILKKQ